MRNLKQISGRGEKGKPVRFRWGKPTVVGGSASFTGVKKGEVRPGEVSPWLRLETAGHLS